MRLAAFPVALLLASTGLAASPPAVSRWGTLRDVLRDGRTEARVAIAELERPRAFGIGALEGLGGELVIVDGEAWLSRPGPSGAIETQRPAKTDRATFAVLSVVTGWTELRLGRDLSAEELEAEVLRAAAQQGFEDGATLPFLVEGRFRSLEAHVLAGACPFASPEPLPAELAPRRIHRRKARGTFVGFLSGEPPGVISHHGSRLHVHALLDEPQRQVGHLEGVTVLAGSVLRLPAPGP